MDELKRSTEALPDRDELEVLEIDTGQKRRWRHRAAFALLVAGLAGLLVWMFVQFGATVGMACLLVLFMLGYMIVMGQWASGQWTSKR